MGHSQQQILIVYNADGGILNMMFDGLHKIISPRTYPCALCALTWGAVSMRKEWQEFLRQLPAGVKFHHKDDFASAYPGSDVPLPAIFLCSDSGELETLVSASDMERMSGLPALIDLVGVRIARRV